MDAGFPEVKLGLEREVLAGALKRPKVAARVVGLLAEWRWESPFHDLLFSQIRDVWEKSREVPSMAVLAARARGPDGAINPAIVGAIKAVLELPGASAMSALDEMAQLSRRDLIRTTANRVLDAVEAGEAEADVVAMFEEGRRSALTALSGHDDELVSWSETAEQRFRDYRARPDRNVTRFPLPIDIMNAATRGGLPVVGRVLMLMADTNVGKSCIMAAIAESASRHPDNVVLHITTEEFEADVYARIDACVVGHDRGELIDGIFSADAEARYVEILQRRHQECGRIYVQELPMGASIHQVRPLIQAVRRRHPTSNLLLSIDSPDYLNSGKGGKIELRHDISAVYQTVKTWTKDRDLNLSCALSTQVSGVWEGKLPPVTGASEARDKGRIVDVGFAALEKAEQNEKLSTKDYLVGINKNRIGKMKGMVADVVGDPGTCRYRQQGDARSLKDEAAQGEVKRKVDNQRRRTV